LEAIPHFEEAMFIYEMLGERRELALRLGIVGNLYSELGRIAPSQHEADDYFKRAIDYYTRTLEISRELNDPISEAELLRSLGNVYGNSGAYDKAIQHFREAKVLFDRLGMQKQSAEIQQSIQLARQYSSQN